MHEASALPLADLSSTTAGVVLGGVSVFAALLALVFAYFQTRQLREQISRLANTEAALTETQARIDDLSVELYDVLNLSQEAQKAPGLFDGLRELASNCAAVYPGPSTFLGEFLRTEFDALRRYSAQARSGSIEIAVKDIASMALTLARLANEQERVIVTSYVSTEDFWTKPSAQRYLAANRELIADRNVKIVRIFLFDTPQAAEKSRPEMDKQYAADIEVRTALTEELEMDLKRDMFLLGDRLAAEYVMTADRKDILSLRIWDKDTPDIEQVSDRMTRLISSSELYVPEQQKAVVEPDVAGT